MNHPLCQSCARPLTDNATLCPKCVTHLERELGDVRSLSDEVDTTRWGQARTSGSGIGVVVRTMDKPLPYNDRPAKAAAELHAILLAWTDYTVEHHSARRPLPTLHGLSVHLLGQVEWIRHRPEALQAKEAIEKAVARLRATVDRRPDRVYAGPCGAVDYREDGTIDETNPPCTGSVYGRLNALEALCEVCGAKHDAKDRRLWLLEAVENQLAHAALLARALSNLGRPVPDSTIRSWALRGRLVSHSTDARGRPVYRVGDVIDLIAEEATRTARPEAKESA